MIGDHFSLGASGFSKVESGRGKLDVERLGEIAKALDVDIIEFFPKAKQGNKFEESQKSYGYASKADMDDLAFLIRQLKREITLLKKEVISVKSHMPKHKK